MSSGSRYDAVIVDDCYRSEAIAQFVADLIDKRDVQPGLVFVRKKRHAVLLAQAITAKLRVDVPYVTSDMPKSKREQLVAKMRAGHLPVAVCTDVWSTGIDIPILHWVLLAGAGQAPAGLKQRAGRGTRLHTGKKGYVVYNWQDVGVGMEAYEDQSRRRIDHLQQGGFHVAPAAVQRHPDSSLEPEVAAARAADVAALETLLTSPNPSRNRSPACEPAAQAFDALDVPRKHFDWATLIFFVGSYLVMSLAHHCVG